jgi:peptidoglycan/LPS O-acetylase OafA/YrhL
MLFNVQVLRAVAAILVVHAHAAGLAGLRLGWAGGANGVDLFFVISGFIIAYVAHLDADQFMTRRLIRIVPIYWASTIAIFLLVLVMPHVFRTASADIELLVRSLLFFPDSSGVHTEDGLPHPTLAGGWTLNYEMYFYVMFWLGLMLSRKWSGLIAIGILGAVITVVNVADLNDSPIAHFYGYPIVLEFVFGIIAFHVVHYVETHRAHKRWSSAQKPVLVACVIGGLVCLAFNKELLGSGPRWFLSGIPSFVVVVCAVLLERIHDTKVTNRIAVMVGDASYVLYLLHAYIVFGVIRLVIRNRTFSEPVGQLVVIGIIAISVLAAVVVYRYFEQPILRRLKTMFVRSRRSQAHRASAR